ncbi:MAG: hypothetical protein US69_C0028G0002 [candidate division TM6 bacterium GW2011_GWF2_38_10]|nr:MAG: hypothetical protein US69_C0028G0002 [candidate division TM6 bacterium GW2011_GWF2_38_10]
MTFLMHHKKVYFVLYASLLFGISPCLATPNPYPPSNLPADQYGNKTHNLDLLQTAIKGTVTINNIPFKIEIPEFIGISHQEINQFLTKTLDFTWPICEQTLWNNDATQKEDTLNTLLTQKVYPQNFLHKLQSLRQNIIQAFQHSFPFSHNHKAFIAKVQKNKSRLMVRSTGKEDTQELANAGGNETIANVRPEYQALANAMGEVVASYLGEKSLQQRLASATTIDHIHDIIQPPFCPVLIQKMIGEIDGGTPINQLSDLKNIPVSGVMFTTDTEAQTPGISIIQTTFGHNEGVVNSLVPTDLFFVGSHNDIHPVIHHKNQRMVPFSSITDTGTTYGLKKIDNSFLIGSTPQSFGHLATLDKNQILALKKVAEKIESYYRHPTDVEFVFMPHNKTIYLVQARPLIIHEKQPSFIDNTQFESFSQENIYFGTKVGIGDGRVRTALSLDHVLMHEHLIDALHPYFELSFNERKKIVCVLTKHIPAATSHEATTFRAEKMPVLTVPTFEKITAWLKQEDAHVIIDVQRGAFINNSLQKEIAINNGWFESPFAKQLSLIPEFHEMTPVQKTIKKLIARIVKNLKPLPLKQAYTTIKTWHPQQEGKVLDFACYSILYRYAKLLGMSFKTQDFHDRQALTLLHQAQFYVHMILTTAHESRQLLLFYLNFLEALFTQHHDPLIIKQYDIITHQKIHRQESRALDLAAQKKVSIQEKILLGFADAFYSDESKHDWSHFVHLLLAQTHATPQSNLEEQYATFFATLSDVNALPIWMNAIFPALYKKHKDDPDQLLTSIISMYEQTKDQITLLHHYQQALNSFDNTPFQNPQRFTKHWQTFTTTILDFFTSERFLSLFKNELNEYALEKNNLAQLIAITLMNNVITKLDSAIKIMKGSTEYHDIDEKVRYFEIMIRTSWRLCAAWLDIVPEGTFKGAIDGGNSPIARGHQNLDKQGYLRQASIRQDEPFSGEHQLEPSRSFNLAIMLISNAAIGSGENHTPKTLEDYFTLAHQNSIIIAGSLFNALINIDEVTLPPLVKNLYQAIYGSVSLTPMTKEHIGHLFTHSYKTPDGKTYLFKTMLVSILIEKTGISLFYNIPLRHHSSGCVIRYDAHNKKVFFDMNFFAENSRPENFKQMLIYAQLLEPIVPMQLASYKISDNDATFSFHITPKTNIQLIPHILARMCAWCYRDVTYVIPPHQMVMIMQNSAHYPPHLQKEINLFFNKLINIPEMAEELTPLLRKILEQEQTPDPILTERILTILLQLTTSSSILDLLLEHIKNNKIAEHIVVQYFSKISHYTFSKSAQIITIQKLYEKIMTLDLDNLLQTIEKPAAFLEHLIVFALYVPQYFQMYKNIFQQLLTKHAVHLALNMDVIIQNLTNNNITQLDFFIPFITPKTIISPSKLSDLFCIYMETNDFKKFKTIIDNNGIDITTIKSSSGNQSLLNLAVTRKNLAAIEWLIEQGVKTTEHTGYNGNTPLHEYLTYMAKHYIDTLIPYENIILMLIQPNIDILLQKNKNEETPLYSFLMEAVNQNLIYLQDGNTERENEYNHFINNIITLMLELGAPIKEKILTTPNNKQKYPLTYALEGKFNLDIIKQLTLPEILPHISYRLRKEQSPEIIQYLQEQEEKNYDY